MNLSNKLSERGYNREGCAKEKEDEYDEYYVGHHTEGTRRDAFLDVSDEVLELAAGAAKIHASFTLGSCTGLSECPG